MVNRRHLHCNAVINTLFLLNGKWTAVLLRSGTETYNVSDAEDRTKVSMRGYLSHQPAKVAGRFSQIVSGCETMNSPSPPLCLKTNPTGLSLPRRALSFKNKTKKKQMEPLL